MRYFLIAGERSGDLHASRIVSALRARDPEAEFEGWGGEQMEQAGVVLREHYRNTATMGFLEVLKKLRHFRRLIQRCKDDIAAYQPDAVIYVDFSAFNLRVAPAVVKQGITGYFFITPKVWAWNTKRAFKLARLTDHRLVILPFEVDFFAERQISATYVGNPLTERIRGFTPDPDFRQTHSLDDRPIVALLPGSRRQEVSRLLPVMMAVVKDRPEWQWVMSGVRSLPEELYQPAQDAGIPLVWEDSYNLMAHAHTAVVASGTATLETALFRVPQVVVYRTSAFSALVVRAVIKIPFVSLPNLIAQRAVVPELLQNACTPEEVLRQVDLLQTEAGRQAQLEGYADIAHRLGDISTPDAVAEYITQHPPTT